uniref:Uncharacterized protein n=1 Tax=Tetranychus urticae TaxID=32264 RepID=T1L1L7_TETUR
MSAIMSLKFDCNQGAFLSNLHQKNNQSQDGKSFE